MTPPSTNYDHQSGAQAGHAATVEMPARADFSQAESLKESLEPPVAEQRDIEIDGANVEFISTPCLQLVIASATSTLRNGRSFTVSNISPAFRDAVADLGLADLFSQWERT